MSFILFLENNTLISEKHNGNFIQILFVCLVAVTVIVFIIKPKRNSHFEKDNFEEKIIKTISSNKIIDPKILEGLTSDDLKLGIKQEILRVNTKYRNGIDLQRMSVLMDELEFENLQKLYQWFYSKKSDN
jgi:hypothetical protein